MEKTKNPTHFLGVLDIVPHLILIALGFIS